MYVYVYYLWNLKTWRDLEIFLCNIRTLKPTQINDNAIRDSVVISKTQMF